MITLEDQCLKFTFPEVRKEVWALVEAHLQATLRKIRLPKNRGDLIDELFEQLDRSALRRSGGSVIAADLESVIATANTLTMDDVEAALREALAAESATTDVEADLTIRFLRTLRLPDVMRKYLLPPGLVSFPLRSVDEFADAAPENWRRKGGIATPIYQSEALWIDFESRYPFAVKIGAGKINAVSGTAWTAKLRRGPQNYLVVPPQPWLDGFTVGKGLVRQFVAMPLGSGHSVEEQLTGKAETGGIQIQVYPMRADAYLKKKIAASLPSTLEALLPALFAKHLVPAHFGPSWIERLNSIVGPGYRRQSAAMGLGAGGKMRQDIYKDPYEFSVWDGAKTQRCFVHLCNSLVWRQITGTNPPHPPLTAKEYKSAGVRWFDYYRDDQKPLKGSKRLARVVNVDRFGKEKKNRARLVEDLVTPDFVIQYGDIRRPSEIRGFRDKP